MRKFFLAIIHIAVSFEMNAQNVAVNITSSSPDASSILDVSSASKGLLIPRMSTSSITSIVSPAKGLLVYDSTKNQLMVNMGTATLPNWQTILYTSGWSLAGNAISDPSANFIGTTNDQPLTIKVNNIRTGYINGYDIAFGNNALTFNQDLNNNIAIGRDVMFSNQWGYSNVAIGARALRANIDRSNLIAIGDSALFRNGSIGMQTAEQGTRNTAIGSKTLYSNTRGYSNTAIGYNSLLFNVEGNFNIGIGDRSLFTSIGNNNTAIGNMSQFYNYSNQNTTVGDSSLFFNGSGNANTAIGFRAGYSNNVYNSTFLGANANAVDDVANSTAIGHGATVSQSNFIQLGDSNIETVNTYGNITVQNGKGIIRSADGIQQKKLMKLVTFNTTIPANTNIAIPFTFPENFSDIPDAYIGDITAGFSFVGVMIYVSGVSASGGVVTVFNPKATSFAVNFNVKIIAIGPQ